MAAILSPPTRRIPRKEDVKSWLLRDRGFRAYCSFEHQTAEDDGSGPRFLVLILIFDFRTHHCRYSQLSPFHLDGQSKTTVSRFGSNRYRTWNRNKVEFGLAAYYIQVKGRIDPLCYDFKYRNCRENCSPWAPRRLWCKMILHPPIAWTILRPADSRPLLNRFCWWTNDCATRRSVSNTNTPDTAASSVRFGAAASRPSLPSAASCVSEPAHGPSPHFSWGRGGDFRARRGRGTMFEETRGVAKDSSMFN